MVDSTPIMLLLFLSCGHSSQQMTISDDVVSSEATSVPVAIKATEVPPSCTNGKGLTGGCVDRMFCSYNTSNIDLSLYGPPDYRNPCPGKEICCPLEFILQISSVAYEKSEMEEDLNFGGDDFEDS